MKRNWPRYILATFLIALLFCGPVAYSHYRQAQFRHFKIVDDGRLYRSGQMSLAGLQRTIEQYGIRTVISLRFAEKGNPRPGDWQEEAFCEKLGVHYVRIRPREWTEDSEGNIPSQAPIDEFLKVMDDPSVYPVLIHCLAGMHRTGSYCAIYRMEYQHWSNEEALAELKLLGYDNLEKEDDVRGFLLKYVPRRKRSDR